MSSRVVMTDEQRAHAILEGVKRALQNLLIGRRNAHGCPASENWRRHIEGALGEYAVAIRLGIPWDAGRFRGPDVGDFQVRTSSYPKADLRLHDSDKDGDLFWLAVGKDGVYDIKGCIHAGLGKDMRWWKAPQPGRFAYFVPVDELTSLEDWLQQQEATA